jgi:hypothetical protein
MSLVTSDCTRLKEGCLNIHYIWSGPLEALAIIVLLIYLAGTILKKLSKSDSKLKKQEFRL